MDQETGLALLVDDFVGLLGYCTVSMLIGVSRQTKVRAAVERQFRNVSSIMTEDRRRSLSLLHGEVRMRLRRGYGPGR